MIVSLTRESRKNSFSNYFQDKSYNLKNVWQGINSIIAYKKSQTYTVSTIISNKFNDYFSNVAKNTRTKIPHSKHFSECLKNKNSKTFFISPTNEKEIILCISSLYNNKGSGPYSIPIKILQLVKTDIAKPLFKIINLSFSTGQFPTKLKTAKVVSIFKKDSPLECRNYRPISLLSNIDKIFEKLMYSRVTQFLETAHIPFNLCFVNTTLPMTL